MIGQEEAWVFLFQRFRVRREGRAPGVVHVGDGEVK